MLEHVTQSYGLLFLLEAGLKQSINPASFLGCIVFAFWMIRVQTQCGFGEPFGAVLLFLFFMFQMVVHIGISDYLYTYSPGILVMIDFVRIFVAIAVTIFGLWYFISLRVDDGKSRNMRERFFAWVFANKNTASTLGKCLTWMSALFCALFLALFCGTWLLNNQAVSLVDAWSQNVSGFFFWRFFIFECLVLLPFFVSLFFLSRAFRLEKFRTAILSNRLLLIAFSGVCVAVGIGTLLYYVSVFI